MKLEQEAERAFFDSQPDSPDYIDAIVAVVPENERPLAGLSGLLDWRFNGVISACIRSGAITGKPGECVFIPLLKNGRTFRVILAGGGKSSKPGDRIPLPADSLLALQKNLRSLKLSSVALSRRDLGNPSEEFLKKNLKDIPIRVAP